MPTSVYKSPPVSTGNRENQVVAESSFSAVFIPPAEIVPKRPPGGEVEFFQTTPQQFRSMDKAELKSWLAWLSPGQVALLNPEQSRAVMSRLTPQETVLIQQSQAGQLLKYREEQIRRQLEVRLTMKKELDDLWAPAWMSSYTEGKEKELAAQDLLISELRRSRAEIAKALSESRKESATGFFVMHEAARKGAADLLTPEAAQRLTNASRLLFEAKGALDVRATQRLISESDDLYKLSANAWGYVESGMEFTRNVCIGVVAGGAATLAAPVVFTAAAAAGASTLVAGGVTAAAGAGVGTVTAVGVGGASRGYENALAVSLGQRTDEEALAHIRQGIISDARSGFIAGAGGGAGGAIGKVLNSAGAILPTSVRVGHGAICGAGSAAVTLPTSVGFKFHDAYAEIAQLQAGANLGADDLKNLREQILAKHRLTPGAILNEGAIDLAVSAASGGIGARFDVSRQAAKGLLRNAAIEATEFSYQTGAGFGKIALKGEEFNHQNITDEVTLNVIGGFQGRAGGSPGQRRAVFPSKPVNPGGKPLLQDPGGTYRRFLESVPASIGPGMDGAPFGGRMQVESPPGVDPRRVRNAFPVDGHDSTTKAANKDRVLKSPVEAFLDTTIKDLMHHSDGGPDRDFLGKLAMAVGERQYLEERAYTPGLRKAVIEFTEGVLRRVESRDGSPEQLHQMYALLQNFRGSALSYSPNLFNSLTAPELLILTAKINRDPLLQATVGSTTVRKFVYEITFARNDIIKSSQKAVLEQPVDVVLDVVHQLRTVLADAAAQGDWARPGLDKIQAILAGIEAEHKSPLVKYLARGVQSSLDGELQDPSLSVFQYRGDTNHSRLGESLDRIEQEMSDALMSRVVFSGIERTPRRMLPIASDVLVGLDNSGLPYAYGFVKGQLNLQHDSSVSLATLKSWAAAMPRLQNHFEIEHFAAAALDFSTKGPNGKLSIDQLAERAVKEFGGTDVDGWKRLISRSNSFYDKEAQIETTIANEQNQTQKKCENLTRQFIEDVRGIAGKLIESRTTGNEYYAEQLVAIKTALEKNDIERAFSAAQKIARFRVMQSSLIDGINLDPREQKLAALDSALQAAHQESWATFESIRRQETRKLLRFHEDLDRSTGGLDYNLVKQNLADFISKRIAQTEANLEEIPARPFRSISDDRRIFPFAGDTDERSSLLLAHLHRAEMRHAIEFDLGIQLRDIPIRSQAQFLRYLSKQDSSGYGLVREAIAMLPPQLKTRFLISFLANAENSRNGDLVVRSARELPPSLSGKIFEKYAELTSATNDLQSTIAGFGVKDLDPATVHAVTETFLKKANSILTRAINDSLNTGESPDSIAARIGIELDLVGKNAIAFGAALKNLRGTVSLPTIPSAKFELLTVDKLTPRDKQVMTTIARINNRQVYKDELFAYSLKSLQASLDNPATRFYRFTGGETTLAFCKVEDLPDGKVYLGSNNVRPEGQGLAIGSEFLAAVIAREGSKPIVLHCAADNPAALAVYKVAGFELKGEDTSIQKFDGQYLLKLERPASKK